MKKNIDQVVHEKLCAYVLGEGSAEERAEMEALLAQSSELQAERARLEATIGLVREAMSPPETLSPRAEAALRAVVAPAQASSRSVWQRAPWMRIAAGIGAVGLAFALYREGTRSGEGAPDDLVARSSDMRETDRDLPAAAAAPEMADRAAGSRAELEREAAKRNLGLGYTQSADAQPKPAAEDARKLGDDKLDASQTKNQGSEELLAKSRELSKVGDVTAKPEGDAAIASLDASARAKDEMPAEPRGQVKAEFAPSAPNLNQPPPGDSIPPAQAPSSSPTAPISGTDSVFGATGSDSSSTAIGVGAGGAKSDASASGFSVRHGSAMRKGRAGGPTAPGTYAASSGPTSPGPSGPSTGGASATWTSTVGGGGGGGAGPSSASNVRLGELKAGAAGGTVAPSEKKLEEKLDRFVENQEAARQAAADGSSDFFDVGKRGETLNFDDEVGLGLTDLDNKYRFTMRDGSTRSWGELTPVEQEEYLRYRCERILTGCRRWPNERPRDMFFRFWGDNPFEVAALDALSTFSVDVDTASYTLARRYLKEGHMPEKAQIRTEEFVNYFKSDVPAPREGTFGIHTDLTPSRYSKDTQRSMLRVVVRGKDVAKEERKPLRLTFVVDVSGSMREQNRLEMVKHCMRQLVNQLDGNDSIAIVKFSTDASIVLPMTLCSNRTAIEGVIDPLHPDGSTNSNAGLQLGYGIAASALDPRCVNRVVFLSDGVANVGETDPAKISDGIKPLYEKGIYLNTIGVGMNNHNDVLLEQLANKTEGVCNYIDSPEEAKRALVDGFIGAVQPIARDVKIQVEFDAAQVLRYRLLGYENRAIADADFRNDKVDAGEVGAGHQVTALYELELNSVAPAADQTSKPLATVHVRYKAPRTGPKDAENDSATEIAKTVGRASQTSFEGAGPGYRRAVIVAQFAEILRRSIHARGDSLDELIADAQKLASETPLDADQKELVLLLLQSKDLILRSIPVCDELCQSIEALRQREYLLAQSDLLTQNKELLEEMRRTNQKLEEQLRELIRQRLQNQGK